VYQAGGVGKAATPACISLYGWMDEWMDRGSEIFIGSHLRRTTLVLEGEVEGERCLSRAFKELK
jgi:hypothetical protein